MIFSFVTFFHKQCKVTKNLVLTEGFFIGILINRRSNFTKFSINEPGNVIYENWSHTEICTCSLTVGWKWNLWSGETIHRKSETVFWQTSVSSAWHEEAPRAICSSKYCLRFYRVTIVYNQIDQSEKMVGSVFWDQHHFSIGSVVLIFEHRRGNFFVATVLKLSQKDVVQISWQFTVKMLTK